LRDSRGRGAKSVDLSANVLPFLVIIFADLISASRLTERAQRANGLDAAMRGTLIKFILENPTEKKQSS